jgi:hypothetical protein
VAWPDRMPRFRRVGRRGVCRSPELSGENHASLRQGGGRRPGGDPPEDRRDRPHRAPRAPTLRTWRRCRRDSAGPTESGLYVSVCLPNLIVGTVGGGTGTPTAHECLGLLGYVGDGQAGKFAEIAAVVVLAGEISINAALANGRFARAHATLGRKGVSRLASDLEPASVSCVPGS